MKSKGGGLVFRRKSRKKALPKSHNVRSHMKKGLSDFKYAFLVDHIMPHRNRLGPDSTFIWIMKKQIIRDI